MPAPPWKHSLKSRIVASYALILILGGLSTTVIGIYVTGQALLGQARRQVAYGMSAGRCIFAGRLDALRRSAEFAALSEPVRDFAESGAREALVGLLADVRGRLECDSVFLTDSRGHLAATRSGLSGGSVDLSSLAPVRQALAGSPAASAQKVSAGWLDALDAPLPTLPAEEPEGPATATRPADLAVLMMLAAAPVRDSSGKLAGVLCTGDLLNEGSGPSAGNSWLVNHLNRTLDPAASSPEEAHTVVTVYRDDVRIAGTLAERGDESAAGTRAPPQIAEMVLERGQATTHRVEFAGRRYVAAYRPIRNLADEPIGMLAVGLSEAPFTATRDEVTLIFAGIALFCFALVVVVTYLLTRSLVRPLEEMVSVSHSIAAGDFSRRSNVSDQSELGLLSQSFNEMLDHISRMKNQLEQRGRSLERNVAEVTQLKSQLERRGEMLERKVEETTLLKGQVEYWARTLEQQVQERTEQLIKAQQQVARQQRLASVGQLAAGVAHEINNPLGGILTFASLAIEELPPDSPLRSDLEEIVNQADRCRRIVTQLLEFSRQREAQTAPANINEVLARTLALLEKQASFHNIKVERHLDPTVPQVVVDQSQMQQVFMNIILNAVQAMEERGTLRLETSHDTKAEHVTVRISDTGCGIPAEHREAIFDPFFTTKSPGEGTGLGLAVAARIVQGHGGRMDVESEVGRGTIFTIVLPVSGMTMVDDASRDAAATGEG